MTEQRFRRAESGPIQAYEVPPVVVAPGLDQLVWVSKAGSDATGDGSQGAPFHSIAAAMASISDASTGKRYGVVLHPGVYSEDFALKPNTWILGCSQYLSRIDCANLTLDPTWNAPGVNNRAGFSGVQLRNDYTFDFITANADTAYLTFENGSTVGAFTVKGGDNNAFFIQNVAFFNTLTQVGGFFQAQNVIIQNGADTLITANGVGTTSLFYGGQTNGNIHAVAPGGTGLLFTLGAFAMQDIAALTLDGASITSQCSPGSLPPNVTLLNGAPSPRLTLTGAKAGNAAVASIATQLAASGLFNNATT